MGIPKQQEKFSDNPSGTVALLRQNVMEDCGL
jgi:hypothetical protein